MKTIFFAVGVRVRIGRFGSDSARGILGTVVEMTPSSPPAYRVAWDDGFSSSYNWPDLAPVAVGDGVAS